MIHLEETVLEIQTKPKAHQPYTNQHYIDAHVAMEMGVALAMAGDVSVSVHLWLQI